MSNHNDIISAESNVSLDAATTAVQTVLNADIAAAFPAPLNSKNVSVSVAVGPIFCVSCLVQFNN